MPDPDRPPTSPPEPRDLGDFIMRARRPEPVVTPLRFAPKPAPPLTQPSWLGSVLGYKPTATLGSQIGRYYENAGGLGRAISEAQKTQGRRDTGVLDGLMWPKWKPEDVTKRSPPVEIVPPSQMAAKARGLWLPEDGRVQVGNQHEGRQGTLEHELSHNAYSRDLKTLSAQREAGEQHGWNNVFDRDHDNYLRKPEEVDVRLAEIKRRYAHHTGNLVTTPEQAKEAWKWWSAYGRNLEADWNRDNSAETQYERPVDEATLHRRDFDFYDSQPDDMKEQFFHRMPELVQSPAARIRGLQGTVRGLESQIG